MSDIQTQIKEAAKWRGVTAPMLMDAMHLTNWSYALRLITGRQDMRISTLEKLAAVLGYEVQLVRKAPRCKNCNDEGIVHTYTGDVIGPCPCVVEMEKPPAEQVIDLMAALKASLAKSEKDGAA